MYTDYQKAFNQINHSASASDVPQGSNVGNKFLFISDLVDTISYNKLLFVDDLKLNHIIINAQDCFELKSNLDIRLNGKIIVSYHICKKTYYLNFNLNAENICELGILYYQKLSCIK